MVSLLSNLEQKAQNDTIKTTFFICDAILTAFVTVCKTHFLLSIRFNGLKCYKIFMVIKNAMFCNFGITLSPVGIGWKCLVNVNELFLIVSSKGFLGSNRLFS